MKRVPEELLENGALPRKRSKKSCVYAVAVGLKTGIFDTWAECKAVVHGHRGAAFKKFPTRAEAEDWLEHSAMAQDSEAVAVYIDGACRNQEDGTLVGGIGVWFGSDNDPRNLCEKLSVNPTNQRAELTAFIRLLETAPNISLNVFTDSEYCVLGVKYRLRGWVKDEFAGVANADLWRTIHGLLEQRTLPICLKHVKGHAGVHGNEKADALAAKACLLLE